MKTIQPPIDTAVKLLGPQKYDPRAAYRPSVFRVEEPCPEGRLLYQSLTGELLLLEADAPPPPAEELVRRRFLVPMGTDERRLCDQLRAAARLLRRDAPGVRRYVIFTTTDCNARCFYCFEHGQKRLSMTEQTAHDTAAHMLAHANGQKLSIRWFGGEPLYNAGVIDVISRDLRDRGAEYDAMMVTNAYLFDDELTHRAKTLWNLRRALVTLDGPEELYNRTKAYIYREGSAFRRVLDNLDRLLDAGVNVTVNVSLDATRAAAQFELADELGRSFGGRPGFHARAALLNEYIGPLHPFDCPETALRTVHELNDRLDAYGIRERKRLATALRLNSCMADSPYATTVLPDGRLGRCEHFGDREEVGSIYDDAPDPEKLAAWHAMRAPEPECAACAFYPHCLRLEKCNACPAGCPELFRGERLADLRNRMRNTYEHRKQSSGTEPGGN